MTLDDLPDPPDVPPSTPPKGSFGSEAQTLYLRALYTPSAERVARLTPAQKRRLTQWDARIEKMFGGLEKEGQGDSHDANHYRGNGRPGREPRGSTGGLHNLDQAL